MFKRLILFTFFILFSYESNASTNISFVNLKYIIENSNAGKEITKILENDRKNETKKLKVMQNKIKKQENEIKDKGNILNETELKKKVSVLRKDIKDYNDLKNKKAKEFNNKKAQYVNQLLKEMNSIMIKYVEKNSIDIVIKKENIITGKKELDITQVILDELNKKKITFK